MSKAFLPPTSGSWRLSDLLAQRLRLAAQPIFNLQTRQADCHEILARLEDPILGIGDSAAFLGELSASARHKLEHAVIGCVAQHIRRTECRFQGDSHGHRVDEACPARTPYLVNVHLRHLSEWLPSILQIIRDVDPARLMFEIVEPSYVDASRDDLSALALLQESGFRFFLDDLESADDLHQIYNKGLSPYGVKVDVSIGQEAIWRVRDACDARGVAILIGERFDDPIEPLTHIQSFKWGRPHVASTVSRGPTHEQSADTCASARAHVAIFPAK